MDWIHVIHVRLSLRSWQFLHELNKCDMLSKVLHDVISFWPHYMSKTCSLPFLLTSIIASCFVDVTNHFTEKIVKGKILKMYEKYCASG
jgi:hypothetical protein